MFNWWTFLFEVINLLVVVFILYRLLFRPVREVIQRRRAEVHASQQQIQTAKEELERQREQLKQKLAELETLKKRTIEEARTEALKQRQMLQRETEKQLQADRERFNRFMEEERRRLLEEVKQEGLEMSLELSSNLLRSVVDDVINGAIVRRALRQIEDEIKEDALQYSEGCEVSVTSAFPLPEDLRQELEALFDKGRCKILYNESPELIGGIVIRVDSRVFDSSIRGNLQRLSRLLRERI